MKQPLRRFAASASPSAEAGRLRTGKTGFLAGPVRFAASLPREARDTLFLLAVIAWVVAMQIGHIPWWCSVLTAAVLGWRT
nr:hypothetical protein [Hydrogenophaga sp.]